jgi:hypothetical protein
METVMIVLAVLSMVIAILVSLIPNIPGPAIVWAIGLIFAALNDFERVPIPAIVVMSLFMAIGSTTEFWLRYLGMRTRGGSCWAALGSIFGGILGTFLIPIPILGTLIGAVLGALIIELLRVREAQKALEAGRSVIETYLISIVVEFCMCCCILTTFLISLWWTA